MKVELLISTKFDESFCCNESGFKKFFEVDETIRFMKNKLIYTVNKKATEFDYKVVVGSTPENKERYFSFVIEKNDNMEFQSEKFNLFEILIEKIRTTCLKIDPENTIINTVWNDIGAKYASEAYPLVNNVENLMRKLITKFFIIKVGVKWIDLGIHEDKLLIKIKEFDDDDLYTNDLYKIDFIQLSSLLFIKKRRLKLDELDRILSKGRFEDKDIAKIKDYFPKSNWDLYFAEILNVKNKELESKWQDLYKLRNAIAHNRFLNKESYSKCRDLCKETCEILDNALAKIDEIKLDEKQIDEIKDTINNSYMREIYSKLDGLKYFDLTREYNGVRIFVKNGIHAKSYIPIEISDFKNQNYMSTFKKLSTMFNILPEIVKENIMYLIFLDDDQHDPQFIDQLLNMLSGFSRRFGCDIPAFNFLTYKDLDDNLGSKLGII